MNNLSYILLWVAVYGAISLLLFRVLPRRASLPSAVKALLSPWVIVVAGTALRFLLWWLLPEFGIGAAGGLTARMRYTSLLMEGACIWWIAVLAADRGLPRWLSLFYAFGPLSLFAWYHGWSSLSLCFCLLGALVCLAPQRRKTHWLGFLLLGLGLCTNVVAGFLVPLLVSKQNRRWLPLTAVPLVLYAMGLMPQGWLPFGETMEFAPAGARLHAWFIENRLDTATWYLADLLRLPSVRWPALAALGLAGAAVGAGLLTMKDDRAGVVTAAWMWLLVLVPGLDWTHLVLPAAFLPLFPQRSWLLVLALAGSRAFGVDGEWLYDNWVYAGFWLPLLSLFAYDCWRQVKPSGRLQTTPQSLDIVVPTLNEAPRLPGFFDKLETAVDALDDLPVRVVVVDAGSSDSTVALARERGVHVLTEAPLGRGRQLARGIAAGNGQLVLMLHADAGIQPDALTRLRRQLRRHPGIEWGALGHVYAERPWRLRLIEFSNRARLHLGGVAFGDQGIFVRRDALDRIGGMPPVKLMEDIELSLRLTGHNCRVSLGAGLVVSTRHWRKSGYCSYMKEVLRLSFKYLLRRMLGADIIPLTNTLYDQYYGPADVPE